MLYLKKEITEWIVAIAVGLLLVWLVVTFVAKSYTIKGDSMDPTLKDGQHVMVNILGYKVGNIKKGNVIVFHANKSDDYVKSTLQDLLKLRIFLMLILSLTLFLKINT